jgi:hypothetical protein
VKSEINVSGNLVMNSELQAYQDNVLQAITKECLAQQAAKETIVSVTVGAKGEIVTLGLSNSGLAPDGEAQLMAGLRSLNLGQAGDQQAASLRITLDFDLAEVLAGAKSTGTKIIVTGGSVTGDGSATGGIKIGPGARISAGQTVIRTGNSNIDESTKEAGGPDANLQARDK